jgi:hypothetical protein
MLLRFVHYLSQAYQDLPPSCPPPRFVKHMFPVASAQTMEQYRPLMPHLTEAFPAAKAAEIYGARHYYTTRVNWFVDKDKAEALRQEMITRSEATGTRDDFSLQDSISSYIATLLNRCGRSPIDKITNAISVGEVPCPFAMHLRSSNGHLSIEIQGAPFTSQIEQGTAFLW